MAYCSTTQHTTTPSSSCDSWVVSARHQVSAATSPASQRRHLECSGADSEQELEQEHSKSSGQDFTRLTAHLGIGMEKPRAVDTTKPMIKAHKTEAEDKLASLKSFRRRNGLCFNCGEKWSPAHTCPPHISLHVLEEFLDALDIVQSNDDDESEEESVVEE